MNSNSESDLSEVERLKIDRAYDRLQRLNYYEILHLPQQATRAQIKKAYYTVSKEFHPDRYFRRNLEDYKEKLESIFDLITKAYNTLNDDDARAEYDRTLIEASFQRGPAVHEIAFDVGGEPKSSAGSSRAAPEGSSRPGTTPASSPYPQPSTAAPGARPVFMDKLQRQLTERILKAREYFRTGKEAFDKGQFQPAQSALQMAVTFDPSLVDAKEMLEIATTKVNETKAEAHYQRGLQELMVGNTDGARQFLKKAVDCKPRKGYYYFKLATLMMESEQDQRQGVEQLKQAVLYDPQNVEYLTALAKAYETNGMPRNALREYEKILSLDKTNDLAQKSLKRLKAAI